LFVAQNLQESLRNVLLATLDVDVDLTRINERIRQAQAGGMMMSLLHVVMCALGRTLSHYDRLISFRDDRELYRYRQMDVAFVVRSPDGLLYTPVVREVDRLDLPEVARSCQTAAMRVHRGRIKPEELEGACFTVSHVAAPGVSRFVALPNRFQSAILAVAAERSVLTMRDGQVTPTPMTTLTLSYDHALCDGVYAAEFLTRLAKEMELALG
jgi:pyruvate dehydrogenase E2 component (dihydrolipoamide acetyltransferase)